VEELGFEPGLAFAGRLDAEDDLASFREAFVIADPDLIYVDGNSLGRLPRRTVERMRTAVEVEWGHDLIRGWNAGWYQAPARVGEKIAQLVGAGPGQVVVSDSTSVNLFKLTMTALAKRPGRSPSTALRQGSGQSSGRGRIVSDVLNFPSDLYILQGCVRLLGDRYHLHLVPSTDGITVDQQALFDAMDERTALVTLSHVTFKSGFLYDAAAVTERAHQVGALVLWDLSHSVGAVPVELDRWGVDLAVGCTYKYLNGGPGAPAFLYVRRDLQEEALSPIWGWFGQRSPFDFNLEYEPTEGVGRFLVGTPPILSLLAMESALDLLLEAGLERVRRKSVRLTSYLVYLVDTVLAPLGFVLGSPRDPARRGSHVSIRHPEGYRINRALIEEMGVLPDFREPDNIRLGLVPLYTSFAEVWEAVDRIRRVVEEERYMRYPEERLPVT
jgi:kynureninase